MSKTPIISLNFPEPWSAMIKLAPGAKLVDLSHNQKQLAKLLASYPGYYSIGESEVKDIKFHVLSLEEIKNKLLKIKADLPENANQITVIINGHGKIEDNHHKILYLVGQEAKNLTNQTDCVTKNTSGFPQVSYLSTASPLIELIQNTFENQWLNLIINSCFGAQVVADIVNNKTLNISQIMSFDSQKQPSLGHIYDQVMEEMMTTKEEFSCHAFFKKYIQHCTKKEDLPEIFNIKNNTSFMTILGSIEAEDFSSDNNLNAFNSLMGDSIENG